jgi:hypothetical protein
MLYKNLSNHTRIFTFEKKKEESFGGMPPPPLKVSAGLTLSIDENKKRKKGERWIDMYHVLRMILPI